MSTRGRGCLGFHSSAALVHIIAYITDRLICTWTTRSSTMYTLSLYLPGSSLTSQMLSEASSSAKIKEQSGCGGRATHHSHATRAAMKGQGDLHQDVINMDEGSEIALLVLHHLLLSGRKPCRHQIAAEQGPMHGKVS